MARVTVLRPVLLPVISRLSLNGWGKEFWRSGQRLGQLGKGVISLMSIFFLGERVPFVLLRMVEDLEGVLT